MTTNVYMDVDGVINAVAVSRPSWGWECDALVEQVNGFPIMYATTLIEHINDLAMRPDVEMHWLTTWEHDAPQLLAPALGIDGENWPVVGTEHHYDHEIAGDWWKLAALRDHLPADRRAVWIDDDIRFDRDALRWLEENPRVRGVCPLTINGITPKQMSYIEDWCA